MTLSRRSSLLFSLASVATIALLIGLGVWQLYRLTAKEALLAAIENGEKLPAISLIELLQHPEDNNYRKIQLKGSYLHAAELHLAAKYHGKELGYHVLTPFNTEQGDTLLVNRGWIPADKKEIAARPETITEDVVEIVGRVRLDLKRPAWFLPQNIAEKNLWFWPDMKQMSDYVNTTSGVALLPYLVEIVAADETTKGAKEIPIPVSQKINLRNDHLEYAITWFALAFALSLMFFWWSKTKHKKA